MFNLFATARTSVRCSTPRIASVRSFHSSLSSSIDKSGGKDTATPSSDLSNSQQPGGSKSGTSATASGTRKSASDSKGNEKSEQQQLKETEEAMGERASTAYGQYGGAGIQEGNFTAESKEGKERKAAAKQGEK
ncbi:uncharacterized protein JCM15063_004452 [Sporobolomyces koalae]|uniref:uncharacterized protein n=1 Tax=Sporobolomyces koalae TaxID=500713 RepID=UPI003177F6C7